MKRVLSVLFVLLFCLTLCVPFVSALEIPNVTDTAGVLTIEQEGELCEALFTLQNKYDMTILAMIDEDFYSHDVGSSAEDWYADYGHGYGNGSGSDGILFYISVNGREYYFYPHGFGTTAFNDDAIEYLKREVEPHLKDGNYYEAIKTYVRLSDELISMAKEGNPYHETDWGYVAAVIGCAIGIPLILAFVMMKVQLSKMNTAVVNDYAANYEKPGSYHLDMARDIFLYSRITKIKKANTSSGPGSSSGGGRAGGGGSF